MAGRAGARWVYGVMAAAGALAAEPPAGPAHLFGRGFDLDRGTDFSVTLGGIPANLPVTVWGPGYLDLDFAIPELQGPARYRRGSSAVDAGAFAIAGAVRRDLAARVDRPLARLELGLAETDRYARLLWAASRPALGATSTQALEATRAGRPWGDPAGSGRFNGAWLLGREDRDLAWQLAVLGTLERGDGGAPSPLRPLPPGLAAADLHLGDGNRTRRLFLGAGLRREGPGTTTRIQGYAGVSALQVWAGCTGFLRDPVRGDQLELLDRRGFLGLEGSRQWRHRGSGRWEHQAGFQARFDHLAAAEIHATQDRVRLQPLLAASAELGHGALSGQSAVALGRWRARAGLRLDTQINRVLGQFPWPAPARTAVSTLLSPSLGLACAAGPDTRFSLSHGKSFRPGDGLRAAAPMARATGTDLSAETRPLGPWVSGVTLYRVDLEAGTVLDPAWNGFWSRGPARHQGLEWHNLARSGNWSCECCLAWNQARFLDAPAGLDQVPGAVGQTGYLAVGWKDGATSARITLRRLGSYPLTEAGPAARREHGLDLELQRDWKDWSFTVTVLNAFGFRRYNQRYCYVSRLPGEPPGGVAGEWARKADPQTLRFKATRRF